jgi:hypothetical protein
MDEPHIQPVITIKKTIIKTKKNKPHPQDRDQDNDETIDSALEKLYADIKKTNMGEGTKAETMLYNKPYNDFLIKKEKYERRDEASHKHAEEYGHLYPSINDPNFNIKIAEKKEFYDAKFVADLEADVEKQAEILCNAPFELAPNQVFVRNFLSFETPYNGLLLYHGLGTGKTCSAISVAEEMRDYMKQMGITQRIIIIASPNVQQNFRLQLFDERKLQEIEPGIWNIRSCTGNKYLKEINPMSMKGLSRDRVIKQINRLINASYFFVGYNGFANYVHNVAAADDATAIKRGENAEKQRQQIQRDTTFGNLSVKKLKSVFSNRLIIIDEAHNIRITDDNDNKKTAQVLFQIAQHATNLRLLLLSGTPMYNSYKEIVWLLNLLNVNDKRSTFDIRDVFDKDGNLLVDAKGRNIGAEILVRKATGYISFVRGENPYTFPYRMFPDVFAPEHTFKTRDYPRIQLTGSHIDQPIEHINVYVTGIGEIQEAGYKYIIDLMLGKRDEQRKGREMKQIEKEQKPRQPRQPRQPRKSKFETTIDEIAERNITGGGNPPSNPNLPLNPAINPAINPPLNPNSIPTFENMDTIGYALIQRPLEALNIVYPDETLLAHLASPDAPINVPHILGKEGLSRIMKYAEKGTNPASRVQFEYKPNVERMFAPENIGKYSAKIKTICDKVLASTGIVLIYSQYIDGGVVPMALALEELGFTRYSAPRGGGKGYESLFKTPPTEARDATTMLPKSKHADAAPQAPFLPAKYSIISGDKSISPDNVFELKALTDEDNKYGEKVKVVIISEAGAEGLDFKNLRQVHIMEPWYNMNLIEQIIGRAIRHCSHKQLPFSQRNVEIYLYGTVLSDADKEAADLYLYRLSEYKAVKIGAVSRLLRETATDCLLNIQHNANTVGDINQVVKQRLSSGKLIDYHVGAKPYSTMCDYMEKCDYVCRPTKALTEEGVNHDTFNERFMAMNTDKIIQRVRELFKERFFYRKGGSKGLVAHINSVRTYSLAQINLALTQMVDDANEYITDKYGRPGHLINIGEYYLFQPVELTNKRISVYERSVPIPHKHEAVVFPLPKNIMNDVIKIIPKPRAIKEGKAAQAEDQGPQSGPQSGQQPGQLEPASQKPQEISQTDEHAKKIVRLFKENFAKCTQIFEKPSKEQDEWYYYTGKVIEFMTSIPEFNISVEQLHSFIVANLAEHLFVKDHLILINYLYKKQNNPEENGGILDDMETRILEYYANQVVKRPITGRRAEIERHRGETREIEDKGILFYKEGTPQLIVLRYGSQEWKSALPEDVNDFGSVLENTKKAILGALTPVVGFITMFKKEYMIFKVKMMTEKRDKGARCDQSGKGDTIAMLNRILLLSNQSQNQQFRFDAENTKNKTQKELCVFQELLLRAFDAKRLNGKRWFLTPGEAVLCNIEKINIQDQAINKS